MEWEDGTMQIRYEMDKLNFDWKTGGVGFEFEPGDIEISVVQRPEVIIKYVAPCCACKAWKRRSWPLSALTPFPLTAAMRLFCSRKS